MTTQPTAPMKVAGYSIPQDVVDGIREASRKTGVSFSFLLAEASRESNFKADAHHGVTSASGLFQFTKQTWMDLVKRHGAEHGLGDLASKISRSANGEYTVSDPDARSQISHMRRDGKTSAAMAAEYAKENKSYLERTLKRPVADGEIYMAHFLGPGGAARLLKADPSALAAQVLPGAANSNRSVFYDATTYAPRTVADVTRNLSRTINTSMHQFAALTGKTDTTMTASLAPPPPPAARPDSMVAGPKPANSVLAFASFTPQLRSIGEDAQWQDKPLAPMVAQTATLENMLLAQADSGGSGGRTAAMGGVSVAMPQRPISAETKVAEPKSSATESVMDLIVRSLFSTRTG